MKKLTAIVLVLSLLLCGCSTLVPARTTLPRGDAAAVEAPEKEVPPETEAVTEAEPETEPETEAETEPEPEPVYYNPLNGTILDSPYTGRMYAFSINNLQDAMPHKGTMSADIVFECFVNNSIIRCMALFSDVSGVPAIGPIRSHRVMWTDLGLNYDAVVSNAGGNGAVLANATERGMDMLNVDSYPIAGNVSFRDTERQNHGYPYDATLFVVGDNLLNYVAENNIRATNDGRDYKLTFTEDATPVNGEEAAEITIDITAPGWTTGGAQPHKETKMIYDADLGKYVWNQYGQSMVDGNTDEPEAFKNVLIMECSISYFNGMYQTVDYVAGGTGWFACNGKAIPIIWGADAPDSPMWFITADGEALNLNQGNTYVCISYTGTQVTGIGAAE